MRKKKLFAALMATVVVAGSVLTGCGAAAGTAGVGAAADGEGKSANAGGKFTIFQSKTEIMDQLNQLAKDYKDETGV